ncbi:hypothetical protein [Pontimicrobium sp. MEBiC06410]
MGKPKTILILRHAEKPKTKSDEYLSIKGHERAAALAYYMPNAFGHIDHIFAAGIGKHSNSHRPVDTVKPLANILGLKVHQNYLKEDYKDMIEDIFSKPEKYTNEQIVVCWQHTDIESIANAFGATNTPTAPWPKDCFDLVWKLTLQNNGSYHLNQIPQLLLHGDKKNTIGNAPTLLTENSPICKTLQSVTKEQVCSNLYWTTPARPTGYEVVTPVFTVPNTVLPNGKNQIIYIGEGYALTNSIIEDAKIAGVLNVAYDLDDNTTVLQGSPITKNGITYLPMQFDKVGLIDGPGNEITTLIAALYAADQLLEFPSLEEQQTIPKMVNFYQQGNLLIHCYDGGSRSVTVTALYIYYKFSPKNNGVPLTFEDIYSQLICYRWTAGAPNGHPTEGICDAAYKVLDTYSELFPEPILKD